MLDSRRVRSVLFLAAAACVLVPSRATAQELTEKEHKELGGVLKRYLARDADTKDKEKARTDLVEALTKIGKRKGEKDESAALQKALSMSSDLGRGLYFAGNFKNARGGAVLEDAFLADASDAKSKQGFAVWLPKTYKPSGPPLPLVLCVPPVEEGKPVDPAEFLTKHLTESEVRDGAIIAVAPMPAEIAAWTSPATSDGKLGGVATLMLTLRAMRDNYAVDVDRVFILGRGEGVAAALSLAARFPHVFAGVVGMAGDAGDTGHSNFRNLPTFFQGAGGQATAFEQKTKDAGFANCTLKADATVAEVWAWMQAHPRVAVPAQITLSPVTPQASKAYWIELPATDAAGGVQVDAVADRATNTITITGQGVRSVKVFLNDAIVDLSKPVKVVLNGRERQEVIARSVDELLLLVFRGTSDAGRVFVAQRDFDLPS